MANSVYANARAKALENNLLGNDRLIRMIDSASAEEGLKILSEVNFGDGVNASFLEFEKILSFEEEKLYSFVLSVCASETFKEFFVLPNDFHNAEVFIKSKYLKTDADKMLIPAGLIQTEKMKEKIMVDDYKDFPNELAVALSLCDSEFAYGKATGASISSIFKKYLYKRLFLLSKKDKLISKLFEVKADSANVGVALRIRNYSEAKRFFVEGGSISENELKSLCEDSLDVLKEKCKFFNNGELVSLAIDDAIKNQPLSKFEKESESFALKLLKKNKYQTDGILPFMLYCYYKKAEIENVRIIMVGLINGLDKNEIKGRLRETYEG